MSEQWIVEAENSARHLAEILLKQITNEANDLCVDGKWYLERVLKYIQAEGNR